MSPRKPFGIVSLAVVSYAAAFFPSFTSVPAYGQQQGQSESQQQTSPPANSAATATPPANPDQPAPRKKKVWTNDEVISLRTPADSYQLEKEEMEAAAAAKKAAMRAAANSEKEPAPNIKLPATADETQKMIKDTADDIAEETVILAKMREEFETTPAAQQPEKQRQIDRLSSSIDTSRTNLKALQDHLRALKPEPKMEDSPSPPSTR